MGWPDSHTTYPWLEQARMIVREPDQYQWAVCAFVPLSNAYLRTMRVKWQPQKYYLKHIGAWCKTVDFAYGWAERNASPQAGTVITIKQAPFRTRLTLVPWRG